MIFFHVEIIKNMGISDEVFVWKCETIIKTNCHLKLNRLEHEDVT